MNRTLFFAPLALVLSSLSFVAHAVEFKPGQKLTTIGEKNSLLNFAEEHFDDPLCLFSSFNHQRMIGDGWKIADYTILLHTPTYRYDDGRGPRRNPGWLKVEISYVRGEKRGQLTSVVSCLLNEKRYGGDD